MRAGAICSHCRTGVLRRLATAIAKRVRFGLLAVAVCSPAAFATDDTAQRAKRADFAQESASLEARHVADWVVDSGDSRGMPFAIIDKADAKVFAFAADGQLRGAAPVLLGLAKGDDTIPGLGDRKLSSIRPDERTTPAGRFVAALGRNIHGDEILWVDYESALSLHRVIKGGVKDQRAQRLATPSPLDNRISFGCINVPKEFYESVVSRIFAGTNGIVYILPETRSLGKVFASYSAYELTRRQMERQR